MKQLLLFACVSVLSACGSVGGGEPAGGPERDPAAFMWRYTEAWNRHDTGDLAANYWHMGLGPEERTAALERTFDNMRAQGYEKSTIHEIEACRTGDDRAWAGMKFTRLKTDGEPLGPPLRASEYELDWDDARGWRIQSIGGRDVDAPLECPVS